MNPNKINIQARFAPLLVRYMTPIIAGTSWNDANIGYASKTVAVNASSSKISSYTPKKDGIRKEKDKPIANNQTFLLTDLRTGFREMNKNAVKNGYAPT
jgi:hypothetical protein